MTQAEGDIGLGFFLCALATSFGLFLYHSVQRGFFFPRLPQPTYRSAEPVEYFGQMPPPPPAMMEEDEGGPPPAMDQHFAQRSAAMRMLKDEMERKGYLGEHEWLTSDHTEEKIAVEEYGGE